MALDLWTIVWANELRNQEIFNLAAWIVLAEDDGLIAQVGPVGNLSCCQRMVLRQDD
jgi:hypothetical protein